MSSIVYDKTDKGREEIATRKYQIPARMRTLLVLVDGRRPLEWLLSNVAGLGLNQHSVEELLHQEFIRLAPGSVPAAAAAAPAAPAAPTATPASARARAVARQVARASASPVTEDAIDNAIAANFPVPEAAAAAAPLAGAASDPAEQFRQLYAFYNRSIKAAIGLRGVMLQLKVEKAEGVEQLRELRAAFLQAVLKAKGSTIALAMREELDALLGGAPEVDDVVLPAAGEPAKGALDFFNMSGGAVEY